MDNNALQFIEKLICPNFTFACYLKHSTYVNIRKQS